jgi:acetamidase/formamidase
MMSIHKNRDCKYKLTMLASTLSLAALINCPTLMAATNSKDTPCLPFQAKLNQDLMVAPKRSTPNTTYILPATPATTQWGWFDNKQPPVLTINSGDTVSIETMTASDNQVIPGVSAEQVYKMNIAIPGRGPHTVTGPIYVQGAEPGDTLKIHFNKIVPRSYASNNSLPGKGLFPNEFKEKYIKYFYLDVANKTMEFMPGIVVPLAPFPGVIAVAPEKPGKIGTAPPGPFGGNMDLRELTEGSTLYLPVFIKGGLIWTGDSHAGQGNGEINLTAIETAFAELNITVDVIKHKTLTWPRAETADAWITVGYDKDLNVALDILKAESKKFIIETNNVTEEKAQDILLNTWNCPISEVVNGIKGVYCIIPKDLNASQRVSLPTEDNDELFVTYGTHADLQKAMEKASMDMIQKIVAKKNLQPLDAYSLASIAMDCRIAPHQQGDKTVHCMLAKNLWTSESN